MLTMLLPGVTVTYNGEEIGMENGEVSWEQGDDPQGCNGNKEDWERNSRDFERTPYHWDSTINAGFNRGKTPWLPVAKYFRQLNLKKQQVNDLKSHYRIYQKVLKLKSTDTFKYGECETLALTTNVLGLTRYEYFTYVRKKVQNCINLTLCRKNFVHCHEGLVGFQF